MFSHVQDLGLTHSIFAPNVNWFTFIPCDRTLGGGGGAPDLITLDIGTSDP